MRRPIEVPETVSHAGWVSAISRRVRERELRRQILSYHVQKAVARHNDLGRYVAGRIPALLPEFVRMLLGSLLGFWIIAALLASVAHATPLYTLPAFGLIYSLQAAYYKYRLSVDPGYTIPRCRCAGHRNDRTETVLQSRESGIWRIPLALLGSALYAAIVLLVYLKHADAATYLAAAGVLVSVYLGYVMVVKIAGLCANCINVAALNVLILWQLLRVL